MVEGWLRAGCGPKKMAGPPRLRAACRRRVDVHAPMHVTAAIALAAVDLSAETTRCVSRASPGSPASVCLKSRSARDGVAQVLQTLPEG